MDQPDDYEDPFTEDILSHLLPLLTPADVNLLAAGNRTLLESTNEHYRRMATALYNEDVGGHKMLKVPPDFYKWSKLYELLSGYKGYKEALRHISDDDIDVAKVIIDNYHYAIKDWHINDAKEYAALNGNVNYLKYLMKLKKTSDKELAKLLHHTAYSGFIETIEYLTNLPGSQIYVIVNDRLNGEAAHEYLAGPITAALGENRFEMLDYFLNHPKGKVLLGRGNLLLSTSRYPDVTEWILSNPDISFDDIIEGGPLGSLKNYELVNPNIIKSVLLMAQDSRISLDGIWPVIVAVLKNTDLLRSFLEIGRVANKVQTAKIRPHDFRRLVTLPNRIAAYKLLRKVRPDISQSRTLKRIAVDDAIKKGDYTFFAVVYDLDSNDPDLATIANEIRFGKK